MQNHRLVDWVVAGVGVLTSVIIYSVTDGRGASSAQWALVLSPTLLGLVLLVGLPRIRRWQREWQALRYAASMYSLVSSADVTSTFVIRINNAAGDARYERSYRIDVKRGSEPIQDSKTEMFAPEVELEGLPPPAVVEDSNPVGLTMRPVGFESQVIDVGGRPHYRYDWRYRLSKPLRGHGSHLQYRYSLEVPRGEAKAFEEDGGILFIHHEAIKTDVRVSIIAPSGYRMRLTEAYREDENGIKRPLSEAEQPSLVADGQVIEWAPTYRRNVAFKCHYRVERAVSDLPS